MGGPSGAFAAAGRRLVDLELGRGEQGLLETVVGRRRAWSHVTYLLTVRQLWNLHSNEKLKLERGNFQDVKAKLQQKAERQEFLS